MGVRTVWATMSTDPARKWGDWEAVGAKPLFTSAMSVVWEVRNVRDKDGATFALKQLRYPKNPGSTAYERFVREISTQKELAAKHDGIVAIVDCVVPTVDDDRSDPYYVMPLAERSLKRAAKGLRGDIERTLKIGLAVADALVIAHEAGVIHRDVKPANVLLFGDEETPRLCDFGICFLVDEDRLTNVEAHTVGSDDYVAPELRGGGQNERVNATVDVYSLGKTMYELASGGTVVSREYLDEARYDLLAIFKDQRFAHLMGLFRRMICERSADRFQSMPECRDAIARALENIREMVPYQSGMYGGSDSPTERFVRLTKKLDSLEGVKRQDAVLDALPGANPVSKHRG